MMCRVRGREGGKEVEREGFKEIREAEVRQLRGRMAM